ncbi:hypothetical protein GCM10010385_58270 [Streptomyces geysiriensis]|uniref:phage major capsid protein n=1 Tax=Streptomyces rochei TaxID=1928 RepID=UPI0017815487|nr:hypothetical protein GCM10010385_58270 [Streptomyces geysiriensis]
MAADNFNDWIPEETDSDVIQRVNQVSAVERLGRHTPMGSATKKVPRSETMAVKTLGKSGQYTNTGNGDNDDILLTARKHTGLLTVAEEDLDDSAADIIAQKERDWATSYARFFDNATLAVSAAEDTVNADPNPPYTSVYYSLTQNNAVTGYTANANIVGTVTTGEPSYEELSEVASRYETGDYFDIADTVVIAHPVFKKALRGVMDDQGRPIFVAGQQGDGGTPDRLFDYPITWSLGCRLSATATAAPTGAPILVVGNRQFLVVGDRSTVETQPIPANISTTDEAQIKMRTRKGFGLGHENAFAILVDDGSALS